jgi:hypothetical protein
MAFPDDPERLRFPFTGCEIAISSWPLKKRTCRQGKGKQDRETVPFLGKERIDDQDLDYR